MEMMNKNVFGRSNLIDQADTFLERVDFWTWSELLLALQQHGHRMLSDINSVYLVRKLLDEVIERLALPCMTSNPSSLSSKCSSFRSSCDSKSTTTTTTTTTTTKSCSDSKSTASSKTRCFTRFWWFEDVSTLDFDLIEMLVRKMVLEKFDHFSISKFLFYYQRVRIYHASKEVRGKIIQKFINLLLLLNKRSISIKGLFETLRVSSNLNLKRSYKNQLEVLIGSKLDQASLDDLLLPSSYGKKVFYTKYDVNIVLRFLKNFLLEVNISHKLCSLRLKRVARLVDLYATEIAPDDRLNASKFVNLAMVIPDSARDSYDQMYRAVEIYIECHPRLGEEQKMKVCSVLNYNKLSQQVLNQLSRNSRFPLVAIVKALVHSNPKLRSSIKGGQFLKLLGNSRYCKNSSYEAKGLMHINEVLVTLARNGKIRAHLQERGWTLVELEMISSELLKARKKTTLILSPKVSRSVSLGVASHDVCCVHGTSIKHLQKLCS